MTITKLSQLSVKLVYTQYVQKEFKSDVSALSSFLWPNCEKIMVALKKLKILKTMLFQLQIWAKLLETCAKKMI